MKIAVSTFKGGLEDSICPTFGRCPTFTILEVDEKEKKILNANVTPNPGGRAGGGAGIAAAQAIVNSGAKSLITGNCGPNAMAVLAQAGIHTYLSGGKVGDAVRSLLEGKLPAVNVPTVPGHFGMGSERKRFGRGLR